MLPASRVPQVSWLVLAASGPGVELERLVDDVRIGIVAAPAQFAIALLATTPRVVVLEAPPATARDVELVARERRRRPGLRAVFLNPPDGIADRLAALDIGFDEALPMTVGAPELAGRLRLLGRRTRTRSATSVWITGDVELDLLARELRRGGFRVHLRPKEFQLLALLATHPRRAYTRQALIARLWGPAYHGDARTIDVHVRWLRSKIEDHPERPVHLVTVHGVGYRLDPPVPDLVLAAR